MIDSISLDNKPKLPESQEDVHTQNKYQHLMIYQTSIAQGKVI